MKTKRIFSIILALVMFSAVVYAINIGTTASAETIADNVFINPVAIAVINQRLYVADNVADGQSVILCYDASLAQPKYLYSIKLDRNITTVTACENGLIVLFGEEFVIYDLSDGTLDTSKIAMEHKTNNFIVDVVMGKFGEKDTPYYLGNNLMYVAETSDKNLSYQKLSAPTAIYCLDGYVYYIANGTINRYHGAGTEFVADDKFNDPGVQFVQNFNAKGIFGFADSDGTNHLVIYDNKTAYRVAQQPNETWTATTPALRHTNGADILDIAPTDNGLYLLDSTNKVYYYAQEGKEFALNDTILVGSDTLMNNIPTGFTSFTLCRPLGYPTNIIYKTKDQASTIADIEKNYTGEYVVLDYPENVTSPYYYVFVNGKFGWVKKSDGVTNVSADDKIEIVDNNVSKDVNFVAKFNSLNTVYVYSLPLETSEHADVFDQKATSLIEADILQQFTTLGKVWFYISYTVNEQTKFGFVPQGAISKFVARTTGEDFPEIVGTRKINASLFSAESLYITAERLPGEEISNENGQIKLYSGQLVNVVKIEGNSALLQVLYGDGTADYGWINADRLIGVDDITTNSIVGLISLGVALLLAIILIAVFIHRKKVKRAESGRI